MTENQKKLLEATSAIRDTYIEEANQERHTSALWPRLTAAAAVLVLIISAISMLWQDKAPSVSVPFFGIRAYAADGTEVVLDNFGDRAQLRSETSDLFPGKAVYVLDIAVDGYDGDLTDIEEEKFVFHHRGSFLVPGDSDDRISIQWLDEKRDGMKGYRIIGWCDTLDLIEITIKGDDGQILHHKSLCIQKEAQYMAFTDVSYNYDKNRTTDELIQAAFNQHIEAGDSYTALKKLYGGFLELEGRTDAAQKLLALYTKIMSGEQIFAANRFGRTSDWLVGMVLSQDVHWDRLTQEEKEVFASFGLWRDLDDETTDPPPIELFPGKQTFSYDLLLDGDEHRGALQISYGDETWPENQEHFKTSFLWIGRYHQYGWHIVGWFDEPTEITLTVTHDGIILCKETLRITPTEEGYKIDVLASSK